MKNPFFFSCCFLLCFTLTAQETLLQNIKGQVTDTETGLPLIGANVVVVDSDPLLGVSTDVEGYFRFENLPVGRYTLRCSYLGYRENTMANVLLTSGKELVIDFSLVEFVLTGEEVVVQAVREQNTQQARLAANSIQAFNAEVAARYAGSRNDVSRMAAGFAGVVANEASRNDTVIQGNSPAG